MSRLPASAILLVALAAVVCAVVVDSPLGIVGLGVPPLLALLADPVGRRTLGRRLLLTAPLVGVAIALRWLDQADAQNPFCPALRVVSAVAWSSWLSTWLAPPAMGTALRSLGVPAALLELIAHTLRFAGQLAATASEAWTAASLRAGFLSVHATRRTLGQVAGVVVVRALDRAESVAIAGALRGTHLAHEAQREQPLGLVSRTGRS